MATKLQKQIQDCKTIAEKRAFLKNASKELKNLVAQGEYSSINEALTHLYYKDGHRELKTVKQWNAKGKRVKKGEKALLLWGKAKSIALQDGEEESNKQFYPVSFVFSENQVQEEAMKYYKTNISAVKLVREKAPFKKAKITSSKDAAEYCRNFFEEDLTIYESVFILLLNRANNVDAYAKISQGGVSGTVIDVKLIAKYAVDTLACGVIMVHNHPTGNPVFSPQDKAMTSKTKEALKWLDIMLLDHIILTEEEYYSFADNGLI